MNLAIEDTDNDTDNLDEAAPRGKRVKREPDRPALMQQQIECRRHNGTLWQSAQSCLRSHQLSLTSDIRRRPCRDCQVGMELAGTKPARKIDPMYGNQKVCARCGKPANDRLVLLGETGICRPCHARQGEIARGRNGKKTPPIFLKPLYPAVAVTVTVDEEGKIKARQFKAVVGHAEVDRAARRVGAEVVLSYLMEGTRRFMLDEAGVKYFLDDPDLAFCRIAYSPDQTRAWLEPLEFSHPEPERKPQQVTRPGWHTHRDLPPRTQAAA